MKIGIMGQLLKGYYSGVENHILNLTLHVAAYDTDNEYTFYVDPGALDRRTVEALRSCNVKIRNTRFDTRRRVLRFAWEQGLLPFLATRDGIDLLHAPGYVAPLFCSIPTVVTIHDVIALKFPRYCRTGNALHYRAVMPLAARRAARVITVSENSKKDIIEELNVEEDRIDVVPNGIDPAFRRIEDTALLSRMRGAYGLPNKILLFVGNLEPKKNIRCIIESFHELKKTRSVPHKLVIVGRRGWLYRKLGRTVAELDLGRDVLFVGNVTREDLVLLYNAADVFLFPSLYEGFGMPPLEAMACGTPVVTSNTSSLPEVVGGAAITVDPRDVGALTEAVLAVMNDAGLREDLIHRGLERASMFTWDRAARQTAAVYRTAVGW